MKTKAIVSAVLTAAMAVSALPLSANAQYVYDKEHIKGLAQIEKEYNFLPETLIHGSSANDIHRCSIHYTNEDGTEVISITPKKHPLYLNLNDGFKLSDVKNAIKDLKSTEGFDFDVMATTTSIDEKYFDYLIDEANGKYCQCGDEDGLTIAEVKQITKVLKEKGLVKDMLFHEEQYSECCYYTPYALTYYGGFKINYNSVLVPLEDAFENYFEENDIPMYISYDGPNGLHCEKNDSDGYFFVYPQEEMSLEEKFDLAETLYNEFQIEPFYSSLSKHDVNEYNPFIPVDLMEYEEGDANLDGTENMADAVFVMQSLANPNKYEITKQGSFNADIDSNGLTNADALAIQKAILKLS